MTDRSFTAAELRELAAGLEALLDAVPPTDDPHDRAIRARLEGALMLARVLVEGRSLTPEDFFCSPT